MKLKLFQIDAFAEKRFEGNPAAVCPLDEWLDDVLLQAIAEENNLSETAFFVSNHNGFDIRWFTPAEEVELCGHATLATAYVIYEHLGYQKPAIHFTSQSGPLIVAKNSHGFIMDFPALKPTPCEPPVELLEGLSRLPEEVWISSDYIVVYPKEQDVREVIVDPAKLEKLSGRGVLVTAPGEAFDFVSRCFFPKMQVNEDPVTGSAHCELAPYWSDRFGKNYLKARQLSKRGGTVLCEVKNDRVFLSGSAIHYMTGEIEV